MAHFPVIFDHFGDISPASHVGGVDERASMDLISDKFTAEILGPATREKSIHGFEFVG